MVVALASWRRLAAAVSLAARRTGTRGDAVTVGRSSSQFEPSILSLAGPKSARQNWTAILSYFLDHDRFRPDRQDERGFAAI
jgi:hypothetical protein